jgi:hypothetical protein
MPGFEAFSRLAYGLSVDPNPQSPGSADSLSICQPTCDSCIMTKEPHSVLALDHSFVLLIQIQGESISKIRVKPATFVLSLPRESRPSAYTRRRQLVDYYLGTFNKRTQLSRLTLSWNQSGSHSTYFPIMRYHTA